MLVFVVLVVVLAVVMCGSGAERCAKSDFIFLLEKYEVGFRHTFLCGGSVYSL